MKPDQQSEILQCLRSASGHRNAVIKMAEGGRPCEQVLQQLGAVDAACPGGIAQFHRFNPRSPWGERLPNSSELGVYDTVSSKSDQQRPAG